MTREQQVDGILATLRETMLKAKEWNLSAARPLIPTGQPGDENGRGAIMPGPTETWVITLEHEIQK